MERRAVFPLLLEMESTIMKRTWWIAFVAIAMAQLGCGGSKSDKDTSQPASPIAESVGAPPAPMGQPALPSAPSPLDAMVPLSSLNLAKPTKPEEVVGAFLDGMKTGNAKVIEGLLSTRAKKEIAEQGLDIAPIGSPQARFEIGVAQLADPNDPNTMLVSSNWLEPGGNGQPPSAYEVVWALIREPEGWRICEMAVDTHQAGEEIQVVNFENLKDVVPAGSVPAGSAPAGNALPTGTAPASPPRTAANPNAAPPSVPSSGLPALPPGNLPATNLPATNLPATNFPATNLPAVNRPASGGLPSLPSAPASGAGRLPPLPAAPAGGGNPGSAGIR